ncbi:hypothetical protein YC2023_106104 [Brassica napus]
MWDLLSNISVDPTRPIVYSSVYRSLRTNLPRECMGFIDFPFYHFPFLETNGSVTVAVDDNRVGPLYKHIFSPASAPSLSFIGITWKVLLFHLFELQSKWIAGVLSVRITLPWKGYDGGN